MRDGPITLQTHNPEPTATRFRDHSIRNKDLDQAALNIIEQLNANGFQAYLVGGCIRDALCDVKPKDFDVATDASLEQISKIFRRSRIVGRRFPIAHVRAGRELIEVSTFRQALSENIVQDHQGMILRDNAYGTLQQDAFRRDFTINALYYDPAAGEIIDFVGGVQDIQDGHIRLIGDTATRLAEDPVRFLRALRFAAKLDFTIESSILDLVNGSAARLKSVPPARLFDEFLKLFLTGHAESIWSTMRDTPLATALFPTCRPDRNLVLSAMRNTDARIHQGASVTPGFLIAVLLWEDFLARQNERQANEEDPALASLREQQPHVAIPRRFGTFAREIWLIQERLEKRNHRGVAKLCAHRRFRAGYDFLCLRAEEEESLRECADWWTEYQEQDEAKQQEMIDLLPRVPRKRRKRRPRGGSQ